MIATACSSGSGGNEVKVGIMGSDTRIWDVIKTNLQKEGINIKLVQFNDYDQPNQALAGGDIDLNAYQHVYFFRKLEQRT
nr:MetQ/NlpA family ABC transporter substrate-binding protein [Holzapfeliella floricola]